MKALVLAAIALLSVSAFAQPKKFGLWEMQTAGELGEAYTTNPSDSTLGLLCSSGFSNCKAYLDVNLGCEEGAKYPALFSGAEGAANIELSCYAWKTKTKTRFVYMLPVDYLVSALKSDKQIGFAFPLAEAGEFKAVRFGVTGAVEAVAALRKALLEVPKGDTRL